MNKADERLIEQAKAFTPPPAYTIRAAAFFQLMAEYSNTPMELFSLAFSMGFIKGQNAAKNEARRAARNG